MQDIYVMLDKHGYMKSSYTKGGGNKEELERKNFLAAKWEEVSSSASLGYMELQFKHIEKAVHVSGEMCGDLSVSTTTTSLLLYCCWIYML